MNYVQNDWAAVRAHYADFTPRILAAKANEWAIDPYAWEGAGIYMTPIERNLWADIRTADVVMYPQYPVGKVFVDFANPVAKVAIECDGKEFHQDVRKDIERDRLLESLGWRVYRITGADCNQDFDEEVMKCSAARRFIDRLIDAHPIKRGRE